MSGGARDRGEASKARCAARLDRINAAASESNKKNVVARDYIIPAIYVALGTILISIALVTLATRDTSRKETAMEITKTLMTFFIGAATGQA
jgi:hypothetical protein